MCLSAQETTLLLAATIHVWHRVLMLLVYSGTWITPQKLAWPRAQITILWVLILESALLLASRSMLTNQPGPAKLLARVVFGIIQLGGASQSALWIHTLTLRRLLIRFVWTNVSSRAGSWTTLPGLALKTVRAFQATTRILPSACVLKTAELILDSLLWMLAECAQTLARQAILLIITRKDASRIV